MSQQKRNITLLIMLASLCVVWLVLFLSTANTKEEIDPTLFHLSDSKAVTKVVFTHDTSKVVLEFASGRWMVNNNYPADRGLVDVLFATLAQAIPKRAAAKNIRDSVLQEAKQYGIKTEFFIGDKIDKDIQVWGDENSNVTYFIDRQGDMPYVMAIPGYRVFVGGIFAQGVGAWRDKRIFNFNWRNFVSLSTTFPNDPSQDFKASLIDRVFGVEGMNNVDTTLINNYLDAVSLIGGDEFYMPGTSKKADSIIQTKPIMTTSVTEVSGKVHSLELFSIGRGEPRALARWGNDYIWFDRRNVLQIYKKRKDFIKQNP